MIGAFVNPSDNLKALIGVEWLTKKGLLVFGLTFFTITLGIFFGLDKAGLPLSQLTKIFILIGFQVIHYIAWLIRRHYFDDEKLITIAFGVTTEDVSRGLYKEIKKRFRSQIAAHGLRSDIKILELPTDVTFSDSTVAESYILKNGIRLLVWGNTEESRVKDVPFSHFNINLSYQYQPLATTSQEAFHDDISKAIQRKIWGVNHADSLHQLITVSGNVLEITLFTIAACLATVPRERYWLKSAEIFEKLRPKLAHLKQDTNFPNLIFVQQKTRLLLTDLYSNLMIYHWDEKRSLEVSIHYAEKALKLDERCFVAHQNMAVFQWIKGNRQGAYSHTQRAFLIRPNDPLPRFNRAFFRIVEGNPDKALKEYKKITSVGSANIIDVILFLEGEFQKDTNNLGFLFAIGMLNLKFADSQMGREQLKEFINRTDGTSKHKSMAEEAKKLLSGSQ